MEDWLFTERFSQYLICSLPGSKLSLFPLVYLEGSISLNAVYEMEEKFNNYSLKIVGIITLPSHNKSKSAFTSPA